MGVDRPIPEERRGEQDHNKRFAKMTSLFMFYFRISNRPTFKDNYFDLLWCRPGKVDGIVIISKTE